MPIGATIAHLLELGLFIGGEGKRSSTRVHEGRFFRGMKRVGSALGENTSDGSLSFPGGSLLSPCVECVQVPPEVAFRLGALRLGRGFLLVGASWSDGGSVTRE